MAHEVRHSIGGRISRPVATEQPGWDFDCEAIWQFRTFASNNIEAWTVASEAGYRFPTVRLKPRFSAKADISSGDHPNSVRLTPSFPRGTISESSLRLVPGRSTSLMCIRTWKQRYRET
jgi:hypothetical protein